VPLTVTPRLHDRVEVPRVQTKVAVVALQLILFSEVFQADPHEGNYLVTTGGGLVMLDLKLSSELIEDLETAHPALPSGGRRGNLKRWISQSS
jgi:predicted unusual protein kinase regulating ubiquinone biosynthesis (AarF/ABC1/UbiB family)